MTMTCLISTYFVHPHINDENIRKRQTKKGHLLLKDLLVNLSLWRIKTFSIDHIEITDIVHPNPFGASLTGYCGIKDRKIGSKNMIKKSTLPWALGSKDSDIGIGRGKYFELGTKL